LFPNAKGLGVTATACRGDNKSLHADQGGLFHALVQGPGMRELIDAGSLCDYRVFAPESGINEALLQIGKTGDFTANSAKAAQKAELIGNVVESYLTHIPGKQAIVFASGVQDAKDIAEQFMARGVSAVALDGTNNDGHRMEQVARFETGETKILTNVDLFGEVLTCQLVKRLSWPAQLPALACSCNSLAERCDRSRAKDPTVSSSTMWAMLCAWRPSMVCQIRRARGRYGKTRRAKPMAIPTRCRSGSARNAC